MPDWASLKISDKGTYLGFAIGPGRGSSSWDKPLAKYVSRVKRWSCLGGGMQYATLAYNVFALSTLLYIAQLEQVPDYVLLRERESVLKMFPGPGTWVIPEDLWFLKESFGLAKSAQPLALCCRAAQFRVAHLGAHFGTKFVSAHRIKHPAQDTIFTRWR